MNSIRYHYLNHKNPLKLAKLLGVSLGENVEITSGVIWGSEPYLISIGDNTKLSQNITFSCHDGGVHVLRNLNNNNSLDLIEPICIGKNCFIGINVTILGGVSIGDNVVIGACSVVTKNLESNFVYAGVPAKKICSIEEYYKKNSDMFLLTKKMDQKTKKEFLVNKFFGK